VFEVSSFKSCVHASIIAVILSIWRSKGDTRTSSRLSPLLSNRCPTSTVTYHKQQRYPSVIHTLMCGKM
jgi:hypothetical protein